MNRVIKKLGINNIHNRGIRGKGITVAVLDSGISRHLDFDNRIIYFRDFVKERHGIYDDEGHGTHVSGIIAGSGKMSKGKIMGVASEREIVSLKVLDNRGMGKEENVITGLHWIIDNGKRYGIRVVNLSFGTLSNDERAGKRLTDEVELLWDLGYVVVAAAGNNGPGANSISTPGDCKKIITVGADNDNVKVFVNGKYTYNYSGRGPTKQCIIKPDIVAPANKIISCSNLWQKGYSYVVKSGTSMATPIVTGIVALMLNKKDKLTNVECKKILKENAIDMSMDKNRQGAGLVNANAILNIL